MEDSKEKNKATPDERSQVLMARLLKAEPGEFFLSAQGELKFNDLCVASLSHGKSLTSPALHPSLGDATLAEHLRAVIAAKVGSLLDPLMFENARLKESEASLLRDISQQLREGLGSLRTHQVQGMVRALHGAGREVFTVSSLVVGRRHCYLPENLTRQAVVTRLALVATFKKVQAPDPWKPAQVLILDKESGLNHLSAKDFERLGYELFGQRAVRVDVVERVLAPNFAQTTPSIYPSLMHAFRCSEEEARTVAKQLKLSKSTEKRGVRRKQGDEGRTRGGRNRSGGQKSGFR